MDRRAFVFSGAALVGAAATRARAAGPVRIGYLAATRSEARDESFRDSMTSLGYVEERDYVVRLRTVERQYDRFAPMMRELLAEGIDILITAGPATRVAPEASRSVPTVFAFSGNPVDAGFVASMARPGGNLTGISFMQLDLAAKRVQLLKEASPRIARLAALSNAFHPGEPSELRVTREAAQGMGIDLTYFPVRTDQDMRNAISAIADSDCDGLVCFPEALSTYFRQPIADMARERRLPSAFGWRVYCEAGGLMANGPDVAAGYARLAVFVDKIVKGAKASSLPIEQPTRIELVVNLATSRAIGLQLPPSLLQMADDLIE
jgi:putative ABC transport system substrate-binding protein